MWLREYNWRSWLLSDVAAGLSVGAMVIPQVGGAWAGGGRQGAGGGRKGQRVGVQQRAGVECGWSACAVVGKQAAFVLLLLLLLLPRRPRSAVPPPAPCAQGMSYAKLAGLPQGASVAAAAQGLGVVRLAACGMRWAKCEACFIFAAH